MTARSFQAAYDDAVGHAASGGSAATAALHSHQVQAAVESAWAQLQRVVDRYAANPDPSLRGFIAEAHHAGTFNIEAVRRGSVARAELLQRTDRGSPDIRVTGASGELEVQVKYTSVADRTASKSSHRSYEGMGKVVPADQLDEVRAAAMSRAHQTDEPARAHQLRDTARHASDRIRYEDVESRPLDEREALEMAREAKRGELEPEHHGYGLDVGDVAKAAGKAAMTAALTTAAARAAPHAWRAIKTAASGGGLDREAIAQMFVDGGKGALEGSLRGAIAGALVTACQAGMLGAAAKSLDPTGIGAATAVALSAIQDAIRLSRGEISGSEFADRCGRTMVAATAGVIGAGIGQAFIPVPVLGAMIGNFIGSMVGAVGYEAALAAFVAVSGHEAHLLQLTLAGTIAQTAQMLTVVEERRMVVVSLRADEATALERAVDGWRARSAELRQTVDQVVVMSDEARTRNAELRARIDRLRDDLSD